VKAKVSGCSIAPRIRRRRSITGFLQGTESNGQLIGASSAGPRRGPALTKLQRVLQPRLGVRKGQPTVRKDFDFTWSGRALGTGPFSIVTIDVRSMVTVISGCKIYEPFAETCHTKYR
jgi:hypothetical protein